MNWQPRPPKYQGIVRNPVSRQGGGGFRGTDTGMQPAAPAPNGGAVMSPAPAQKATSPQLGNPAMPKAPPQQQPGQTFITPGALPVATPGAKVPPGGQPGQTFIPPPPGTLPAGAMPPRYNEQDTSRVMAEKAAAGTLTAADAIYARQNGNEALAVAILRAVAGYGWNYTPAQPMQTQWGGTTQDGIDPTTGQPVAAPAGVYNRPEMAPPPQAMADVDVAPPQARRYQVRTGGVSHAGKGIYTG